MNILAEITLPQIGILFGVMMAAMGPLMFGTLKLFMTWEERRKRKNGNPNGNSVRYQSVACGVATDAIKQTLDNLTKAFYALRDEMRVAHGDSVLRHKLQRQRQEDNKERLKEILTEVRKGQ